MIPRRVSILSIGLALLIASAGFARAEKRAPVVERVTRSLERAPSGRERALSICQMGEPDTSLDEVDYITPPNDTYLTFLPSTQCPACDSPDSVLVKFAHVVLDYPVQCMVNARVAILGASGGPGCWAPDTNDVLCPPRDVVLEPTNSGVFDMASTLTSGCKVAKDAFLSITFMTFAAECTAPLDRPRLVLSSQCSSCTSYNEFDSGGTRRRNDLCAPNFFTGRPTMYVEGELCVTPALRSTWGALKIRYR